MPESNDKETSPVMITADQAVYAKAVEVCNNPRLNVLKDRVVPTSHGCFS